MMSNDNNELPEKGNIEETTVNGEIDPTDTQTPVTAATDVNNSTQILIGLQDVEYDIDQGEDDSNSDDEFVEAEETGPESVLESKPDETMKEEPSTEKTEDEKKESSPEKDDEQTATSSKKSPNASSSSDSSKPTDKASSNTTPTDTRRRVKLYMLNQNRTWDDRGTGYVRYTSDKRFPGTALIVQAEADDSILLESKIQPDTAYQKQQDTLIVWSEDENYDLALSFQERAGCEEIWAIICQEQGKDPALDITQNLMEDEESDLPPCEIEKLDEIHSVIASSLTLQGKKENISIALESENYIPKLLELFVVLEERKDITLLRKMFEIIKNIFLLNQNSLLEILVSEDCIWEVFGILEYDPNGAAVRDGGARRIPKKDDEDEESSIRMPSEAELVKLLREKRHREFLKNFSKFKNVVPREKKELVSKIHQTYRVQYIQDVILPSPSVFEDNMLSTLSSFIFFNKVEIVNLIQQDRKFLQELFRQLSDETPSFNSKRRDLVMFFKELCTFSHTLQLQNRDTFIKTLQHMGLLDTVQMLLSSKDSLVKNGGVDILNYCVDYSPSMIREFCINQTNVRAKTTACPNRTLEIDLKFPDLSREQVDKFLINVMIKQMILDSDPDMGVSSQLAHTLKILLDPENMLNNESFNVRHLQSSRLDYHNFFSQKSEKMDFLNFFYKYCVGRLVEPLEQVTTVKGKSKENLTPQDEEVIRRRLAIEQTSPSAQLLSTILDLLTFCVEHHGLHIRSFILMNNILNTVVKLVASRHTFLVLAVIRFLRRVVNLKDEFYYKRIVTANIFGPVFDVFFKNGGRYNLLDSAVIDLFEFIKLNNNQLLINYIIDNFWTGKLEHIDYVKTFKSMKSSAEQFKQLREKVELNNILLSSRFRRDRRDLEKEEETWFREDDDDDDDSIEDEDDPLDIYVPNERPPPSLRLTSRIKRQKTENDQSSESSISSIFTSTFKAKPNEERKLKINITSKSLGNAEVKCDPSNDSPNQPKIENENNTETMSKAEPCPESNEIEMESIYEDTKVNENVDSTSIMMEIDSDSKTCVDSTINESKAATAAAAEPTIDESNDESSQKENHTANANTTASKPSADSSAVTQQSKENGSSTPPSPSTKDDIIEFVSSSSTLIPQDEAASSDGKNVVTSDSTITTELCTIKKAEVSSSSSLKNKRKLDDDSAVENDNDDNNGEDVHETEPITTSDSNGTKLINRNKRICLSTPANEHQPDPLNDNSPGSDEKHLDETSISQSH